MDIPRTKWARTRDGVDIAYQDLGQGDATILLLNGWVSHLEVYWEQPRYARFMRRLAAGMRVLVMDERGIGMSDRVTGTVDLETRVDDLGAVMDDAGVDRAALLAWGMGGPSLAAFFAAVHPERTVALCIDPYVQVKRTAGWPFGCTQDEFESELLAELAIWGDDVARGTTTFKTSRDSRRGTRNWAGSPRHRRATSRSLARCTTLMSVTSWRRFVFPR